MARWYKTSRIWKWLAILQTMILLVIWSRLLFTWFEPLVTPLVTPSVTPPVTLSLLVLNSEVSYWEPLTQDFQVKYPEIKINLTGAETTDDIKAIYTNDFKRDSPTNNYDLVYMDIIWLPKFAEEGWLRKLDDQIPKAELKEDFLKQEVELGQYKGDLYRIPFRSDAGVLFYRKDLLEKAGIQPPKTFPEVLQASQKLKDLDLEWRYLWQGKQYEGLVATYFEVLLGYHGFWIEPNTRKVGLGEDEAIKAAEFLHSVIDKEISPKSITRYDEEEVSQKFVQGEAAFMRGWPDTWDKSEANNSDVKGNVGFISIVNNSKEKIVACLGGWGFGIAAKTQHPEQAWQAIKFFTSEEAQRKFVIKSSYLPTRKKLFTDREIVTKYPQFKDGKMLQIVNEAVPRPIIPEYDEASKILQSYLSKALSNELTPETAMRLAARETQVLLEKVEK